MAGYLGGTPFLGVVPAQQTLLHQLNAAFPRRSTLSDGALGNAAHAATISFHNPNPQGLVQARDFTHDVAGGLDCNVLAAQLVASGDRRILEVIWNRRYWTPKGGWVPYVGTNPHDKHLHLSVVSDAALYNDTRPWALPMLLEDDMFTDADRALLRDTQARLRGDTNRNYDMLQSIESLAAQLLSAVQSIPGATAAATNIDELLNKLSARLAE